MKAIMRQHETWKGTEKIIQIAKPSLNSLSASARLVLQVLKPRAGNGRFGNSRLQVRGRVFNQLDKVLKAVAR